MYPVEELLTQPPNPTTLLPKVTFVLVQKKIQFNIFLEFVIPAKTTEKNTRWRRWRSCILRIVSEETTYFDILNNNDSRVSIYPLRCKIPHRIYNRSLGTRKSSNVVTIWLPKFSNSRKLPNLSNYNPPKRRFFEIFRSIHNPKPKFWKNCRWRRKNQKIDESCNQNSKIGTFLITSPLSSTQPKIFTSSPTTTTPREQRPLLNSSWWKSFLKLEQANRTKIWSRIRRYWW